MRVAPPDTAAMEEVYLVDGARTPFLKARGRPGAFSASDLAVHAGRALLLRQPFAPNDLDEVILGCAAPSPDETNIGRVLALRLGCGDKVPGWTVMRNCASGMQALDAAMISIQAGRAHLVLAGGTDALSRAPLLYSDEMVTWFADMASRRGMAAKLRQFLRLRPTATLRPVIGLLKGLTDPVVGLSMGQTAENIAHRFGIRRQEMDAFAVESHRRAVAGRGQGAFDEIIPLVDPAGKVIETDDGVRPDSSIEALARLSPVFDKPDGQVTAGNSSQVTDGAALCILASGSAVRRLGLRPLARIHDIAWAGLDPAQMGLGPIHASVPILRRHRLQPADLDLWEINEAFAAQVIGCLRAWEDEAYCQQAFGTGAWGSLATDRLNIHGGAIAMGHPVGASGARIALHLANALRMRGGGRGIAAICIGGGQGGAMLLEAA
jgi:acetyl-CoA C-acetyltransferase